MVNPVLWGCPYKYPIHTMNSITFSSVHSFNGNNLFQGLWRSQYISNSIKRVINMNVDKKKFNLLLHISFANSVCPHACVSVWEAPYSRAIQYLSGSSARRWRAKSGTIPCHHHLTARTCRSYRTLTRWWPGGGGRGGEEGSFKGT